MSNCETEFGESSQATAAVPDSAIPSGDTEVGRSLARFFGFTFLITWPCFSTAAFLSHAQSAGSATASATRGVILFLGIFAPAFVALALTAQDGGRPATFALLRRLVQWQAGLPWYVFAAIYMAVVKLAVAALHRLALGSWPRFGSEPWYLLIVATVFSTVIGGQVGEELGWRGYALPRLATRFGLAGASAILGVIWAAWHLPLFFYMGADTYRQSFPFYVLQVTALSVAIAWLYGNTKGSLLLTMLMHAAINNTKDIVPSAPLAPGNPFALRASPVGWLTLALLWGCAAYFLIRMSSLDSRRK